MFKTTERCINNKEGIFTNWSFDEAPCTDNRVRDKL